MTDPTSKPLPGPQVWTERGQCEHHGSFELPRFSPPGRHRGCPGCIAAEKAQQAERDALWKRRELETDIGLIGRFRDASFETFKATTPAQKRVLKACQEFAAGPSNEWRTLWLQGPVGVGKSHLLAAMARATTARLQSARVVTARELVRRVRATWRRDAPEAEVDVINDLACCGLLAVDEIGVGFGTDGEVLHLFDVLDRRYQLQLPTAIATNLTPEQLRAAVGDRLFDRLAEGATVRACDWPSHRRRGAA